MKFMTAVFSNSLKNLHVFLWQIFLINDFLYKPEEKNR